MEPGSQANRVNKMLIKKAELIPVVRKTPTGGRRIPKTIRSNFIRITKFKWLGYSVNNNGYSRLLTSIWRRILSSIEQADSLNKCRIGTR